MVLSLDVGGLERIVLHLAREGISAGQQVSVVCLERAGRLAREVESTGARVIPMHKQPGLDLKLASKIRSVLDDLRPDVIHTHQIGALLYTGRAARRAHVPVIVHTEHINHLANASSWIKRMRMRVLWWLGGRFADRFITVARDITDAARGLVPSQKLYIVDNGIPVGIVDEEDRRAQIRETLGIPADAPVIGTLARLSEIKCQDILIRAFGTIKVYRPDAHLLLVGDGPCREALTRLAAELGMSASVHFVGFQAQPHWFLQAMDIFALPSRLEGMPLAILEAWAARLPVIATSVGDIPRAVIDGTTGILISPGDQQALERELRGLLEDPRRGQSLGRAGRQVVERDYDTRHMADQYERHYVELLRKSRRVCSDASSAPQVHPLPPDLRHGRP